MYESRRLNEAIHQKRNNDRGNLNSETELSRPQKYKKTSRSWLDHPATGQDGMMMKYYSFWQGKTKMPISKPDNAPITKMDMKSTVRMLPAPGEILKKLPVLIARRITIKAILRFRFFMVLEFAFSIVLLSR